MFLFNIFSLTTILLYVLLSPGMLLTLPPGALGVFRSGQTSFLAVLIHAIVFVVLLQALNLGITELSFYLMKKRSSSKTPKPPPPVYPSYPGFPPPPPPPPAYAPGEIACDHNCGKYSDSDCMRCKNCGVCTTTKIDGETGKHTVSKRCLPGDRSGALFDTQCQGPNWQYGSAF